MLPKTGILYFFYSADRDAWGFDYKDKNKFKVIYWNGDLAELQRASLPEGLLEDSNYNPCTVDIKSEISLPPYGHNVYDDFDEEISDIFWEEIYDDGNINKVLGYSDNIQNEMELECEFVTNGLYCGKSWPTSQKARELEPNAKNWQLLLQIDSNDESGMMWGDAGRIYVWIKKDDLLNRNFDKSWFILQYS